MFLQEVIAKSPLKIDKILTDNGRQQSKKYYYKDHEMLKKHLSDFVIAYNYAQPLAALKGLYPFEEIVRYWEAEPEKYKINTNHLSMELNNEAINGTNSSL